MRELAEAVLRERPHLSRHAFLPDSSTDESPFKGLPAFEEADAGLFFGRDALIAELIEHLRHHHFLTVIGASGSGKSSVVRAGVVPALKGARPLPDEIHLPEGGRHWYMLVITPTATPLEELAHALTQDLVTVAAQKAIQEELAADPESLHLHLRKFLERQGRSHLLLVVDQFEELFTLVRPERERQAFIDNLLTAVYQPNPYLHLIITLRADFYHHCAQYDALRQALESQQKYMGEMSQDELRQAIELPADRNGLRFDEGLVDLMLRDVGAAEGRLPEPGALPLLSHALLETWRRRKGNVMTLAGYTAAGGVRGAIAGTADATYTAFTEEEQAIARNIFLRLTELGEGTQDTRRRAALAELIPQGDGTAAIDSVLKTLADARLVTTHEDAAEVAHEALIREWPTLRTWLDENRTGLRLHRQLTEDTSVWVTNNRDDSYLYRGARLESAKEWAGSGGAALNALEQEFLERSQAHYQDELAWAQARAEREADAARTLRQRAIFLRVALGIAAALAVVAFLLYRQANNSAADAHNAEGTAVFNANLAATRAAEANEARVAAEAAAQVAQSRTLAAAALAVGNDNAMRALLLAIEAGRTANTSLAFTALNQQLPFMARPRFTLNHEASVHGAVWKGDGSQILTLSGDDGTVKVWDAGSGTLRFTLNHGWPFAGAVWNEDGSQILTYSTDGTAEVWDAVSGALRLILSHEWSIDGAMWNGDESQILTYTGDETVKVWDADNRVLGFTLRHDQLVTDTVWNEDESQILTRGVDGTAKVWDAASGALRLTLSHDDSVYGAVWNEDESQILTYSRDGTAKVWDASSGALHFTLSHQYGVNGVVWSGDESQILTAGADGTAKVWDAGTGALRLTLGHDDVVIGTVWNEDESQILTYSWDGTAKVWDAASGALRLTLSHEGVLTDAMWNGDESQILTDEEGRAVKVWDAGTGALRFTLSHQYGVISVMWNGDESQVLTAGADGTAKVWDAASGALRFTLSHDDVIYDAVWNGDESQILTYSRDGTVKVWDAATGRELFTLVGDGRDVIIARWNKDESRIMLTTSSGFVGVYYAHLDDLLAVACQYATRNLSWSEWQLYLSGEPYRQTCANLPPHPSVPAEALP